MAWILLSLLVAFLATYIVSATTTTGANLQTVQLEMFFNNLDDGTNLNPCSSPDNYTLPFNDVRMDTGECLTHIFPDPDLDGTGLRWRQYSVKVRARPDGGLNIWLYFTRDATTGAFTYCVEPNIEGIPYPMQVSAAQNAQCVVLSLPLLDPYAPDHSSDTSMAVRVTYDVNAALAIGGANPS
jgi:hypothetical protein